MEIEEWKLIGQPIPDSYSDTAERPSKGLNGERKRERYAL